MSEEKNQNNIGKMKFRAEPTRHFPRYRIPAYIEIDGKRYKLKDWSIGGCAIIGLPEEYLQKRWATGNLIVPFDTFDTVIKNIKLEFLRKNPDGTIGCRFTELRPDQISLMQDIIEAYLEGSIEPSVDEFINTIKREDLREALEARKPKAPKRAEAEEILRRIFITFLFVVIILTLVIFILEALYTRVYLVRAVSAFYDAPLKVIRTPASGFFKFKNPIHPGDRIKKDEILGFMNVPGLVSFVIPSPVEGTVTKVFVTNNDAVREGDPLMLVLPKGKRVYVFANILHKDLERVRVGDTARVIRFDGKVIIGKIVEIKASPSLAALHSTSPMPAYSFAWNYDRVKIELPPDSCSLDDIGNSVEVQIDLTPPLLKPVFALLPKF
ncbi:HlyD family efflux transporter periplasmic adaptor subunit [Thermovibrio ammonificans]|jgi:alginate biosynthesis protein Alg44|uniref:Biotin/lipoyl attachment domain-containing protein n=1 Tax=Thermovibrio ammonificans (strain DSM 15698 / JCM 12110 / HB-1) TaxID=648996 RepID=E8T6H7_THEA1|nr:HlyD family efflux transporter periplasmic adaptor subunit [Thermovibrio ammonificans]ADU96761.1 biotin/lipoyl attachment domain-containing protein [Thermovibrio ammonificans HB-1]